VKLTHDQAADIMRAADFEPLEPYRGVDAKWRSRCLQCSRESTPTLTNVRAGKRCKYCNGREVDPGEAVAEMRAAGFEPLVPYPGTNEPWKCRCTVCGFEPTPALQSVRKGHGCRNCAGQVLDPAEAERVMRAAGLIPQIPYPGADKPWPCHCPVCGGNPSPTLSSIRAGCGCEYCGRIKSGQARRTPEVEAVTVMRAAGLEPTAPYPGASKAWQCRCTTCDRTVSPSLATVQNGAGTGCRYCAGISVDPVNAERIMRAAHLEPQTPYPGALEPWPCVCTVCGNPVQPLLNNIRKGQGCKHCAIPGFDYTAPAVVYVMCHPLGSVKIGVCGLGDQNTRISNHQRNDWEPYQQLRLPTGEQAYRIEQAVLARLRSEGRKGGFMSPETMPQGGWTETFDTEIVPAETMWEIVRDQAKKTLEHAPKS